MMSLSTRLLAAAVGLVLPLALGGGANAAALHSHRPAHVRTATYHAAPRAHRVQHATRHHTNRVAQAHRHALTRGS